MREMAVTSRDVARLAGVSVATVSRVFAGGNAVKEETRQQVLQAARQLNYTPNTIARSLKVNRSKTVGLVIPDIRNPYFFEVAAIMANELERQGYKLLLSFNRQGKKDELGNLQRLMEAQVEALAFTPRVVSRDVIDLLAGTNLYPLQIHSNVYSHIDSILNDDVQGMADITQYLVDRGHRDILLLSSNDDRGKGMLNTLEENGLDARRGSIVYTEMVEDVETVVEEALRQTKPTAVIVVAQKNRVALLKVLKRLGLRFPKDISVVGYDDDALSEYLGITTMGHDIQHIGREISAMLLENMQKDRSQPSQPQHRLTKTRFIERTSVAVL